MKANELRIGNLLDFEGEALSFEFEFVKWDNWELFKPIPLTEEWLLKFGFTFYRENMYDIKDFTFLLDRFTLWDYTGEERYFIACSINHVHQLQNLYFALTGEELEIK